MIKTIKDLCEFIWYLEDKYKLLSFEIDNVKVWQYLRMEIYYLMAEELGILEQRNKSQQSISVLIKNSFSLFKNIFIANPFLTLNKQKDVVVFTHNRSKKIEDKFEDIYTQSLVADLRKSNKSFLCFEKPFQGKHLRDKDPNVKYQDFILLASILYGKLYRIKDKDSLGLIRQVEKEIENATNNSIDLISLIKRNVGRYKLGNKLYLSLFNTIKPMVIYSVASYSYLGDMICAAKTLGIKTIELQHGVISKYHMGYSFEKKQDLLYYSDVFYSWGNFWNKSVNNTFNEVKSNGFQYFRDRIKCYNNTVKENKILILSQTALGEKIMNETLKLVNKLSGFQILYKLHPEEYKMYKKYPSYSKLASNKNLIFIEECNLYQIMSESKIQIGVFSTALYEGVGLCCNTFLYNLNGLEYMRDLIDSGHAKVLAPDTDVSSIYFGKRFENNFF
tara:strand:+ start:1224 stop:2564 length:1341 start_codon:yes stop_codon:yes gene_type:complete